MELNAAGLWSDFKNRSLCAGGGWQQHGGHEYGGERKPDLSHSAPDARPFVSQCQQNFRSHRNFVRGPETCALVRESRSQKTAPMAGSTLPSRTKGAVSVLADRCNLRSGYFFPLE